MREMNAPEFFDYCNRLAEQFTKDHGIDYIKMVRDGSYIILRRPQTTPRSFPHKWSIDVRICEGDPQELLAILPGEGETYRFEGDEFTVRYLTTK